MVNIFSSQPFYTKYVKQPQSSATSASYLYGNPKLYLFFKDVIGAIDGSHIHLSAPSSLCTACRNQKGQLSQNCLFCCSFDMIFTYAMTSWEGSASDACVFESALHSNLKMSEGTYLLADAGFPHCKQLLVPYRGKHYHLAEWR
jgi:DDE superfamily endonuclease